MERLQLCCHNQRRHDKAANKLHGHVYLLCSTATLCSCLQPTAADRNASSCYFPAPTGMILHFDQFCVLRFQIKLQSRQACVQLHKHMGSLLPSAASAEQQLLICQYPLRYLASMDGVECSQALAPASLPSITPESFPACTVSSIPLAVAQWTLQIIARTSPYSTKLHFVMSLFWVRHQGSAPHELSKKTSSQDSMTDCHGI